MKNKYIFLGLLIILSFMVTGCFMDPYKNEKFGVKAIESWFSYKNGEDDLGKTRRKIENISNIDKTTCKFIEKYKTNYIFKCELTYKAIGETVIPFASAKTIELYTVFTPKSSNEFTYKVYNSKSKEGIWKTDII